jgi:hypothetical protein
MIRQIVLSYAKIRFNPPHLAGTPVQFSIMQRTLRLTLLLSVILLTCAGGCTDRGQILPRTAKFDIDGVQYYMHWIDVCCSYLVLHQVNTDIPVIHEYYRDSVEYGYYHERFCEAVGVDGNVIVKANTLYLIQDNKLMLEKSYQELGIDASRLNIENSDEVLAYLQPILEILIREHVQPQDMETEEQEE